VKQSYSKTPCYKYRLPFLQVITREDENGNVKLECPAISKQQFTAGRFHIDSRMTATKDADRIARLDVIRIIYQ